MYFLVWLSKILGLTFSYRNSATSTIWPQKQTSIFHILSQIQVCPYPAKSMLAYGTYLLNKNQCLSVWCAPHPHKFGWLGWKATLILQLVYWLFWFSILIFKVWRLSNESQWFQAGWGLLGNPAFSPRIRKTLYSWSCGYTKHYLRDLCAGRKEKVSFSHCSSFSNNLREPWNRTAETKWGGEHRISRIPFPSS